VKRAILLADDSPTIQRLVTQTFVDGDLEIISVSNGDAAIKKFEELRPQSFRGRHPYVIPSRIVFGVLLSLAWIAFWIAVGRPDIPLKLIALTVYNTLVPVSFRGAVEHHSHRGDEMFANEYRVLIPLFNLNKHVHHHEEPRRPWYLLEYRTGRPLWTIHYFTHWFRVYVVRDYVLMRPFSRAFRK
jgi:CheY-like chemotaxis protein